MTHELELLLREKDGRQRLCSPGVGLFTRARAAGELVAGGEECGTLLVLGIAHALRAPEGASGRIVNPPPERLHAPLGYGDLVYELEAQAAGSARPSAKKAPASESTSGLVLRSPQTGRFYHRPGPKDAAFVEAGQSISEGTPVGLIEVMKTFTHVVHRGGGGLPAAARVVRYLVADGADVKQGEPLLELQAL